MLCIYNEVVFFLHLSEAQYVEFCKKAMQTISKFEQNLLSVERSGKQKEVYIMSSITWLHLSDLHFQKNDAHDRNIVLEKLLDDIDKRTEKYNSVLQHIDFVCFTGDIAFAGKSEEYVLAFESFIEPLLKCLGLDATRLFVVPGNHDINRDLVTPMAKVIGDTRLRVGIRSTHYCLLPRIVTSSLIACKTIANSSENAFLI